MLPLGVRLVMVGSGLLHAAASATGTVTGRVFNPATGNYVASAEVRIAGTGLLVSTEPDGSFRLTGVPAGSRRLTVSYTGTRKVDLPVEVRAGEDTVRRLTGPGILQVRGVRPDQAAGFIMIRMIRLLLPCAPTIQPPARRYPNRPYFILLLHSPS